MRRRDFIILLAGAMGGRPSAVRAQHMAMPVIGWLSSTSPNPDAPRAHEETPPGLRRAGLYNTPERSY
jgi:hypothetical protein